MSFSNINANINFRHFKCCYHDADDICKFYAFYYENVDISMLRSIWSPWRNERGATTMTTQMVPRQYFDDPTTRRDVGAKESGRERVMQGWWGAPGFRFPRDGDMANEERAKTFLGHGANTGISYNTCMHSISDGHHLGIIPSKRAFSGRFESSREVVVHVS